MLREALSGREGAKEEADHLYLRMGGADVLFKPHAIPDALSVAPAKEMVGQPFLEDHLQVKSLSGSKGGPVHIIACHKTATETQARKLLGFPDAMIVKAPFGIYVADDVQKGAVCLHHQLPR